MSGQPAFLVQTLASAVSVGTLFNTYTTAKSVINATDLITFQQNALSVGSKFRIRAALGLSNIVTTPGTVTFQVMMGSIVVWTSGAIQMTTTANTLARVEIEINLRLDTIGSGTGAAFSATGKVMGLNLTIGSGANPTVSDTTIVLPATGVTDGTGFDSTIADQLDFWTGFSISNAGNGVQVLDYTVEQLAGGV